MRIQEIMSQPPITCRVDDTLDTAARQMWDHDCGAIAVVTADGNLAGIITDRDVCMAAFTQGRALSAIPVALAMASQLFTCEAGDDVEAAERLMASHQVRRIPVVDGDNRPVGMLSLNDIARQAAAAKRRNGADRLVVDTLAAICQPRAAAPAASPSPPDARPAGHPYARA